MKFCPKCGSEVSLSRYCSKCGTQLKDGMRFCAKCGNSLNDIAESVNMSNENGDVTSNPMGELTPPIADNVNNNHFLKHRLSLPISKTKYAFLISLVTVLSFSIYFLLIKYQPKRNYAIYDNDSYTPANNAIDDYIDNRDEPTDDTFFEEPMDTIESDEEPEAEIYKCVFVDLGLPSSTLWATCNLGAENPYENGNFYPWGETTTKNYYSFEDYIHCEGENTKLTKYCTTSNFGYEDNKTQLELIDDAAFVHSDGIARTPTIKQFEELRTHCIWTWNDDHHGYYVKSKKNGDSIFMPIAGYYGLSEYCNERTESNGTNSPYALYWTCEIFGRNGMGYSDDCGACLVLLRTSSKLYATGKIKFDDYIRVKTCNRAFGLPIRPVAVRTSSKTEEKELY